MTSAEQKWERAEAQAEAERRYWLRRTMRREPFLRSTLALLLVMVLGTAGLLVLLVTVVR